MKSRGRSGGGVSEQGRRIDQTHERESRGRSMRLEHDFPQPAKRDERAERRGDPPVQRHKGGETWSISEISELDSSVQLWLYKPE